MMKAWVPALGLCLATTLVAEDKQKPGDTMEVPFLLTADAYLKMSQTSRRLYCVGFIDALQVTKAFGGDGAGFRKLEAFLTASKKMTPEQVEAVITQYVQKNPKEKDAGINLLAFRAIAEWAK